jgi:deoxyribodipyrimidine photolyase-like uncharacterized protein
MYLKQNTYQYSSFFMITLRSLMWRKYLKKLVIYVFQKNNTRNVQTKKVSLPKFYISCLQQTILSLLLILIT